MRTLNGAGWQVLCALYSKTLAALEKLPRDALYRKHTEQIVQQKLQTTQAVHLKMSVAVVTYRLLVYLSE